MRIITVLLSLLLVACGGGSSSGGGNARLVNLSDTDVRAVQMAGGLDSKWLAGIKTITRSDGAFNAGVNPNGDVILGTHLENKPAYLIALVLVHEAAHARFDGGCTIENEDFALNVQIDFDGMNGGQYIQQLRDRLGQKRSCDPSLGPFVPIGH